MTSKIKTIIQKDKVVFENGNKAHGFGEIDSDNFIPFTKNPAIAKVFREIGYAEELGSGVKYLYKYSKLYGGSDPRLVEGDVFTTTILLDEVITQVDTLVSDQDEKTRVKTRVKIIEKIKCMPNITNQELATAAYFGRRGYSKVQVCIEL